MHCVRLPESVAALPVVFAAIVAGSIADTMEQYPGEPVDPVQFPKTLYAFAFASAAVTRPVEPLLLSNVPSPENDVTPDPPPQVVQAKEEVPEL